MSLVLKKKEWRRRLVHVLILGLLVTSIPSVPVQAQENAQYVSEDSLQLDVSGGDVPAGDVALETQTGDVLKFDAAAGVEDAPETVNAESSIVDINADVGRDTFYYEAEDISVWNIISSIELTLDDGTVETCSPWDEVWNGYGLNCEILDAEGNNPQWDENGKYPIGDYICKIYASGSEISCEIPVKVISIEDVAVELEVGGTVSDLSGTETYDYVYYIGGHWLKVELNEPGTYEIAKTQYGTTQIMYPEGSVSDYYGTVAGIQAAEAGTYYCYVKGSDTFDTTLTKMPDLTGIRADVGRDTFYYEAEGTYGISISEIISSLELTLDDGTVETCSLGDGVWNGHGLNYEILDVEGNNPQRDENGKNPIGDYICKIYVSGSEISCEIPVKVVSIEDVAVELEVGGTVSGLSGTETYGSRDYIGGHWLKVELNEPGTYELAKTQYGDTRIIYPEGSVSGYYGTVAGIQAAEAGIYYCYVKGSDTFDTTLTKMPDLTGIRADVGRDTFYYEVEGINDFEIISSIELTLDDGKVETCSLWDEVWNRYGLNYEILDAERNNPQRDENGKSPIGDYICKIYASGSEISCEIPVKVVSIEDVAVELEVGGTVSDLSGTNNYQNYWDYVGGHWFKMELTEPGTYEIAKTQYGTTRIIYPEGSGESGFDRYVGTVADIQVTEVGTYYCYVKGKENFSVTLKKRPEITEINAVVGRDTFYYELEDINLTYMIPSIELTLDNGTVKMCSICDEVWNRYGLNCEILDAEGDYPQREENQKFPIGDYICRIYVSGKEISSDVPVKVMSVKDATDMPDISQEAVSLSKMWDQSWYKLEITEDDLYEVVISGGITKWCAIVIYDESRTSYGSKLFTSEGNYGIGLLNKGIYYVSVISQASTTTDTTTVQLKRLKDLVSMEYSGDDITFKYGEWGYAIEGAISSNVSTRPQAPNSILSGNSVSMPISVEGTLSDDSTVDMPFQGALWRAYMSSYELCNKDGSSIYADYNGYLANGEYQILITAYGGISLGIPFKVVGGPKDLVSLEYTGAAQEFKYGTWGYTVQHPVSGNSSATPVFEAPKKANADLNQILSGNNYLNLDFSLDGETEDGDTDVITYKSPSWTYYKMKCYFYDSEGKAVCTDDAGYIPVGSYIMKCVTHDGVECEVPFTVYPDVAKDTEERLETAVDQILDAASGLTDEELLEAEPDVKKEAVTKLLQKIEAIYEEQDIAEIGAASAEKSIELVSKLTEAEKQIEDLLGTSVTVEAQDKATENLKFTVKNALLSVPAGENAEVRVSTTEVPANTGINQEQAVAVTLELVTDDEEKKQLQAPVVITMKLPDIIRENEKIVVYHYHGDDESAGEVIPVCLNNDHTISFVTGSFSTFVIVNVAEGGGTVSGKVTSFGDEAESTTLKLLDGSGAVVAEVAADTNTGAYQFEDVAAGSYTLAVSKTNHVTREYNITVADEAVVQDVEIRLIGDVTGDGRTDSKDLSRIYKHVNKTDLLTGYEELCADVIGTNGRADSKDLSRIYTHVNKTNLLY